MLFRPGWIRCADGVLHAPHLWLILTVHYSRRTRGHKSPPGMHISPTEADMADITEHSASLQAAGKRFALVVSRYNEFFSSRLLSGAADCLMRHGAAEADLEIFRVPGSFELPLAAKKVAQTGRFHAVVCLGAVLRGQTSHFDFVAAEAAKGVARVALDSEVPTIFGVITTETVEQAVDRAGARAGNRGAEAALAAIEMANLIEEIAGD